MAAAGMTATTLSAEPTKQSPLDGCRHLGSVAKRALPPRSLRQMLHLLRVNARWTQGVDGAAVSIFSGILVLASVTTRPLMKKPSLSRRPACGQLLLCLVQFARIANL